MDNDLNTPASPAPHGEPASSETTSPNPVEVLPDVVPPAASPKPLAFAAKFESVRLTLAFLFLALFLSLWAASFIMQNKSVFDAASAKNAKLPTAEPVLDLAKHWPMFVLSALLFFLMIFGAIVSVILFLGAVAGEPPIRARIRNFFCSMKHPPRAALGPLDAFTVFFLMYGVVTCLQVGAMLGFNFPDKAMQAAIATLLMDYAWTVALLFAVLLSYKAAGGWQGVRAFWPPWNSTGTPPARPIWRDIALGAAAYPLIFWLTTLLAYLTQRILHTQDHHSIVDIFAKKPSPLALSILFVTVTIGAAFFEEIMFRGILYNALRKWVRPAAAAVISALMFSAVHQLVSSFLSLFVLGLALTWLYEKTGRLVASMTLHFINNLVSLIMLLVMNAG